nr:MAG TPA: hypothetical protein [Bacteriophage sp.]
MMTHDENNGGNNTMKNQPITIQKYNLEKYAG